MKKTIIIGTLAVVIVAILVGVLYPVLYNKSESNGEKKVTVKSKYISNKTENEYIIFNSNNTYIYHFEYFDEETQVTKTKNIKGTYSEKLTGGYKLDDKYDFDIRNDKLYFSKDFVVAKEKLSKEDLKSDNAVIETNKIFFNKNNIEKEINLITDALKIHLNEPQELQNLAKIEEVIIPNNGLYGCFRNDEDINMICQVNWKLKLTNYSKEECDKELETGDLGKFSYYTISSGECLDDGVTNGLFLTLEETGDGYKITSSFSGV